MCVNVQEQLTDHSHLILCSHCDLLTVLPSFAKEGKAICPRCGNTLHVHYKRFHILASVYALCSLLMFILSFCFPFVYMRFSGIYNEIYLDEIPKAIFLDGYLSLSVIFVIFALLLPGLCMLAVPVINLKMLLPVSIKICLIKLIFWSKSWCMVEIFLIGVLVSFVKLMSYGDVGIRAGFILYCFFCVLQIKALIYINKRSVWQFIAPQPKLLTSIQVGTSAIQQNIRLCQCCHAILPGSSNHCPRCHSKGYVRTPLSLQRTLGWLLTSIMLYIPANIFPIMITGTLSNKFSSTILSGVILLWDSGSYPVAMIIFCASILVPSIKILAILWLTWQVKSKHKKSDNKIMLLIYDMVEIVGRWSMIDIFVIAVLSTLVHLGGLINIYPDIGAVLFALVVILTMLAARAFDPRLIWDKTDKQDHKGE